MSTKEKDTKEKDWLHRNLDTDFGKFMLVWLPIMALFIVLVIHDPDSLLTDDQKLEKQKEIMEAKEQRDLEWEQNVSTPFDEGVRWLVHDRPFPINIIIGLGIFWFITRAFSSQRQYSYGDSMMDSFANPMIMIPSTIGLFYLLWVSGELENWGII